MLNPDSEFFKYTHDLIESGNLVGHHRPVGRVTFIDGFNNRYFSDRRPGLFRSNLSGQGEWIAPGDSEPKDGGPAWEAQELQVWTINISRSLDQDAATCTIEMPNVRPGAWSPQGDDTDPFGFGYLSSMRAVGTTRINPGPGGPIQIDPGPSVWGPEYKTTWHYPRDADTRYWSGLLRTNRLVRTYQGYGSDNFDENGNHREPGDPQYVHPHYDSRVTLTGVWLIDKVTRRANPGEIPMITIECRDLAKLLITQYIYPRMVPMRRFPLVYRPAKKQEDDENIDNDNEDSEPINVAEAGSVSEPAAAGHGPRKAFDEEEHTFWLSGPHEEQNELTSIEAVCRGNQVNAIILNGKTPGAVVWVSVRENGEWQGEFHDYPTSRPDYEGNHGIKRVMRIEHLQGDRTVYELPRTYEADYIRLTFTYLKKIDDWPDYRAGLVNFEAKYKPKIDDSIDADWEAILDWSEPIRELCAWAGFTWWDAPSIDPLLGRDRDSGKRMAVWGDFEIMGAGPIVPTTPDYFVSKSFMEGIRQIVDFLGGIFYIDQNGAAQYRMPNVWSGGNWVYEEGSPIRGIGPGKRTKRVRRYIEFHEDVNLLGFQVTEDDSVMRHEILVVGKLSTKHGKGPVAGGISLVAPDMPVSFRGLLNGQKRLMQVPGDATKFFSTEKECQRMAELTGIKLLFAYRRAQSSIVPDPCLHLDDQVKIYEKTTHETFIHYVNGIESSMDLRSGTWSMNVTTNWLGENPPNYSGNGEGDWFVDTRQLTNSVLALPGVRKAMGSVI